MKTVLITGATSGIGLACARKFAENGDRLILTGRNEHLLSDIRKELAEKGTEVYLAISTQPAMISRTPAQRIRGTCS